MSYRSALANRTTSTGGVGTTLTAKNALSIPLTTNVGATTCSLILSKGVWSITSTVNIVFDGGTTFESVTSFAQVIFPSGGFNNYLSNNRATLTPFETTAVGGNDQESQTFTLNVLEDSTSINQIVTVIFTGGAVSAGVVGAGIGSLWAVKIA